MKAKNGKKKTGLVITVAFILILGVAGISFAGWGEGHGNHRQGEHACGNRANISDAEYKAVAKQREQFTEKTVDIRRNLAMNQALLQAELIRKTLDEVKSIELQKEISALRGQLDQFELAHMMEMKNLAPEYAAFCSRGMGHGAGCGMVHAADNGMDYRAGHGMHQ